MRFFVAGIPCFLSKEYHIAQEAAQTYPHLELLVPCFVPCDESMRQALRAACYEMVEKGRTCHVIWPEEAVFDRLAALARGAYVHWHLPWIDVAPNFVALASLPPAPLAGGFSRVAMPLFSPRAARTTRRRR